MAPQCWNGGYRPNMSPVMMRKMKKHFTDAKITYKTNMILKKFPLKTKTALIDLVVESSGSLPKASADTQPPFSASRCQSGVGLPERL